MKLSTKLMALACMLLTLATGVIKFHFIPSTERYLELSIRNEMIRDARAFEHMILIVAAAAGKDKNVVRRALLAITQDRGIPVELRRAPVIERQYGKLAGHGPQTDFERQAIVSGKPAFRKTKHHFEYVYPLRAQPVCANCHALNGQPVKAGTVLGLAVKRLPARTLHESSLAYFVMDLFWQNLVMVGLVLAVVILAIFVWALLPLDRLLGLVTPTLEDLEEEEGEPDLETHIRTQNAGEFERLRRVFDLLMRRR